MFSSNATPAEEYQYAAKLGAIINLDDITHIDFLEKLSDIFRRPSAVVTIRVDSLKSAMISWITREMQNTV